MGEFRMGGAMRRGNTKGLSLIEVMVAMAIMLVSLGALFGMFSVAVGQNANQGDAGTRTTEYAQDKMEQLMALGFTDTTSNTATYPTTGGGGSGLVAGGSVTAGTLAAKYWDYFAWNSGLGTYTLQNPGAISTTVPATAAYVRQWSITNQSATMKIIRVRIYAVKSLGPGAAPVTTLVCYKSSTT